MSLEVCPMTLKEANAFVEQHHRHHKPVVGHKFSIGCTDGKEIVCVAIVWFLGWLVCCAWAAFSNKFRAVCKAESLIFEYRKYHEQFLAWLKLSEEDK